jgi:hypothetical protein
MQARLFRIIVILTTIFFDQVTCRAIEELSQCHAFPASLLFQPHLDIAIKPPTVYFRFRHAPHCSAIPEFVPGIPRLTA